MSSMVSNLQFKAFTAAAISALAFGSPSSAQSGANGDGTTLVAQQPSEMQAAIAKWELLQSNRQLGFFDYAPFAMAYPDFPRMGIIRIRAENALAVETPSRSDTLRYFDAL
ncbi:MAG: lytic transglycosylase domain-containing protein, partial [Pseudomonadota bacterium]